MKIRTAFVSNSSTSSYVISWLPADIVHCDACNRGHLDPLTLLKGSTFLREHHTEIKHVDPVARVEDWKEEIFNRKLEIVKLEKHPAGEVIIPDDWEMTPEERDEYLTDPHSTKVWQSIHSINNTIHVLERKIRTLQKVIDEGRNVVWAILYADDPVEDQLVKMKDEKLIRFERDL